MSRFWITRASPGAEATATRVTALGHQAVIAPVLKVVAVAGGVDLEGVGALAFTSANGVRAFADRCPSRELPVFAVGAATARAAETARFSAITSADGDVSDLAVLIASSAEGIQGAILHPGATEPAGDLIGELGRRGVAARALALYETLPMAVPTAVLDRIAALDGVLIHSPRAGARVAEILRAASAQALTAYCLSSQVSATLTGLDLGGVAVAPLPNEEALLSLL